MADAAASRAGLKGLQKAAVLLISLDPAESANVLKNIPEEQADRLAKAIMQREKVTPQQLEQVLEEFEQYTKSQRLLLKGGLEYAQKLLVEAYGPDSAKRLIERVTISMRRDGANFENLRKVDPQELAKFVQDEHPQTIALILSHLDPVQAATLISSLPVETRTEVVIRMADLDQISPEIVRNIASVIDQKLGRLGDFSREVVGGVRAVANIANRLEPNICSQLLASVDAADSALVENIRRLMFVFRDLEGLETNALRTLISKVERSTLLTALKGADESLRQKFLQTQSQRAAEMMIEDISCLGPVKLKDVDAAQQQILTIARELEKEGQISLRNSGNEEYVY